MGQTSMTDKNTSKNRPLMMRQRERSDGKEEQGKQSAICSRPLVTREPAKKQEGHDGWQNNGQQQEWENPQQHHGKQQHQQPHCQDKGRNICRPTYQENQ